MPKTDEDSEAVKSILFALGFGSTFYEAFKIQVDRYRHWWVIFALVKCRYEPTVPGRSAKKKIQDEPRAPGEAAEENIHDRVLSMQRIRKVVNKNYVHPYDDLPDLLASLQSYGYIEVIQPKLVAEGEVVKKGAQFACTVKSANDRSVEFSIADTGYIGVVLRSKLPKLEKPPAIGSEFKALVTKVARDGLRASIEIIVDEKSRRIASEAGVRLTGKMCSSIEAYVDRYVELMLNDNETRPKDPGKFNSLSSKQKAEVFLKLFVFQTQKVVGAWNILLGALADTAANTFKIEEVALLKEIQKKNAEVSWLSLQTLWMKHVEGEESFTSGQLKKLIDGSLESFVENEPLTNCLEYLSRAPKILLESEHPHDGRTYFRINADVYGRAFRDYTASLGLLRPALKREMS
jgi:hypothetical protein